MLYIKSFTFNAFSENTYVLYNDTKHCFIIDAGNYDDNENHEITNFISENNLFVNALINTHCHVDHVLGIYYLKEFYKTTFLVHEIEEQVLKSVKLYAPLYGFLNYSEPITDQYLASGSQIILGNDILNILFVPGHSPGHVAFVNIEQKICISGDVLFYDSIGRTDLPGGNFDVLIQSIQSSLFSLPDDVIVYPGHGPTTTIGREKKLNPYCAL